MNIISLSLNTCHPNILSLRGFKLATVKVSLHCFRNLGEHAVHIHHERNGNVPKVDEAWREPLPLDLRGGWKSCVACCVVHSSLHPSSHVLCIRPFSFSVQSCTMYIYLFTKVYSELPRSRDDACLGGGYFYQVL